MPAGASGSSMMRAKDFVVAGAADQLRGGETSAPEQVNFVGMVWPSENAVEERCMGAVAWACEARVANSVIAAKRIRSDMDDFAGMA